MKIKNIFLILIAPIFAQVSTSDLNSFTNLQLDEVKEQLMSTPLQVVEEQTVDMETEDTIKPVEIIAKTSMLNEEDYFGYNYFMRDITFFDNIPTPIDYRLGPGDQIVISIWGETNSRKNMIIDKDGTIFYENIGFINLSNQTIESAEKVLIEELSKIYSTLKDKNNSSQLTVSLGQLKSINIYFSGHINNPGINLVHPFSDIFSAISQAGGINSNGSLREVQLIRNNKVITKVDFYDFFMSGKNSFSNIKLIEGDVIHIPNVKNRVKIDGQVNRPSTYELLENEKISDLINFSSGLTASASTTLILNQILPINTRKSDDNAMTSLSVNLKNIDSISLNNGDMVKVLSLPPVDSEITIYGRVKSPGVYPGVNTTLKNILDIAGGFEDPIFRSTIREDEIVILREDINQFYSLELKTSYADADKFNLLPNDKIFVYENINLRNSSTYRVEGEVNKPGTYPFKEGITVEEALKIAGGLTEASTFNNVVLFQEYTEFDEVSQTAVTSSEQVARLDKSIILGANSILRALPFESVVRVEGNVYNPGLVAYENGLTMYKAIEQAGGHMPNSMKKSAFVRSANGQVDKANLFRGRVKRLVPGDTVVVPVNPNPSEFNFTAFIADLSVTMANIAAILLIVENQSN
jgi:protein involved in polysaccharide export with SLBB domain